MDGMIKNTEQHSNMIKNIECNGEPLYAMSVIYYYPSKAYCTTTNLLYSYF